MTPIWQTLWNICAVIGAISLSLMFLLAVALTFDGARAHIRRIRDRSRARHIQLPPLGWEDPFSLPAHEKALCAEIEASYSSPAAEPNGDEPQ